MTGLKEALIKHFGFSETEWELTAQHFTAETLEAKKHFLKEGEIASKLGFVKNGLLRSYYYNDDAKDITLQFFTKGTVVISADSFNNKVPAIENIVAYETTELLTITCDKMEELYAKVPRWQLICKDVADLKNKNLLDRTREFQTLTATERYQNFCEQYPRVIMKVPLSHIASYLGIDIATLSRLRKKQFQSVERN